MDNDAFKVYEEPDGIVQEPKLDKTDSSCGRPANLVKDGNTSQENISYDDKTRSYCCCFYKSDGDLQFAGTTAEYHQQNEVIRFHRACSSEVQSFLSSAVYYIFVIISTIIITVLLLMELFIDSNSFQASTDAEAMEVTEQESEGISTALHWFSFAILSLFFIEMILRIAAWRMKIVRDVISVIDCSVIFIAFVSNLCAALIKGTQTPIDAISLIIILRLIRIHSLISVKARDVKNTSRSRLKISEEKLQSANGTISKLRRQVMDKDFEIRQLHAYLGDSGAIDDPQIRAILKESKRDETAEAAVSDADLRMAIALSKQSYDKENGMTHVNKAFSPTDGNKSKMQDDTEEYAVLVHKRPSRTESQTSELENGVKMTSFIDEYFCKSSQENLSEGTITGAIRKDNHFQQPIFVNNSNNIEGTSSCNQPILNVLGTDNTVETSPITICIDPNILSCDGENQISSINDGKTLEKQNDSTIESIHSSEKVSMEKNVNSNNLGVNLPSFDALSSDESGIDSAVRQRHISKVNTINQHSGSSLGSESGYQSEEICHIANGKLTPFVNTNSVINIESNEDSAN